ncbi:AraC family transcriptional regulator [Parapedobacter pyrenivorans]|uniref:AraC family transcriptional regulator n=1 Tax=Parapedobacter pyrenivorans TaxID=1305674 RepID=UPI00333F03F3
MQHQLKSVYQHQSGSADMSFVVREYLQPHFNSPFHFHDAYELIMIPKSQGKLYAGTKVLNFTDGEIFLFGPGLAHCFLNDRSFKETGETAHAIVIFFKEDFLGDSFFENAELVNVRSLLQASSMGIKLNSIDSELAVSFRRITQSKGMEALLLLLQMLHRLSGLHEHLVSIDSVIPKVRHDRTDAERLEKVIRYIIDNFKDEPDSKEAASIACMNEAAFCRYFKRRTEKTFSQFVNYVRVTHATNLLSKENWTIASICYECGYKNISYFNRQFKTIIGVTPLEYRSVHRGAAETLLEEVV